MQAKALLGCLSAAAIGLGACGPEQVEMPPVASAGHSDAPPSPPDPPPPTTVEERCLAESEGACYEAANKVCQQGSVVECQAACDGHNLIACTQLADIYVRGERVPQDEGKAHALRQMACEGGRASVCRSLGQELEWNAQTDPAAKARMQHYYDVGCAAKDLGNRRLEPWDTTCGLLASHFPAVARPRLEEACSDGALPGCELLVRVLRDKRDDASVASYRGALERLCEAQYGDACGRLKDMGFAPPKVAR